MTNKKPGSDREPEINKKRITFFNSFKEMEEERYRMLASLSYEERLANLERMRKLVYHSMLLPNGKWPPLTRKIAILKLPYEVRR